MTKYKISNTPVRVLSDDEIGYVGGGMRLGTGVWAGPDGKGDCTHLPHPSAGDILRIGSRIVHGLAGAAGAVGHAVEDAAKSVWNGIKSIF